MKEEIKGGDAGCQHTYSRQEKGVVTILVRVCTKCGQEEIMCDNPHIDLATAKKILKRI